jgi:DNA-binding protein HU-beta
VNKTDIVKAVANETGKSEASIERVLDSLVNVIVVSVSAGESVTLRGFGKFEARQRRPLVRKNPRTGEQHNIPERRSVAFVPAKYLRQRLNK